MKNEGKKMNAYQKIIEQLNATNIEYKIHSHAEIPTVAEAKEKVDFNIEQCFKTLAFKYEDKILFISLLAEDKLKYSKLCTSLNIKRKKLKRVESKELEDKYGYESGGIAPISVSEDIAVIFDRKINDRDIIFCGSGRRDKTIELKSDDIISLDRTVVIDITEEIEQNLEQER